MSEALTYRYRSDLVTDTPVSGTLPETRAVTPKPLLMGRRQEPVAA